MYFGTIIEQSKCLDMAIQFPIWNIQCHPLLLRQLDFTGISARHRNCSLATRSCRPG